MVVGIEPLRQLPVDVRQRLRVEERMQVAPDLERERNRAAREAIRHSDTRAEPARGIRVVPGVQGGPAGIVEYWGRAIVHVAVVYPPARDLLAVPHDGLVKFFDALPEARDDVSEVGDHGSSWVRGVCDDRQQGWAIHPVGSRAPRGLNPLSPLRERVEVRGLWVQCKSFTLLPTFSIKGQGLTYSGG